MLIVDIFHANRRHLSCNCLRSIEDDIPTAMLCPDVYISGYLIFNQISVILRPRLGVLN